jgi:photosystem II stability/assembly factor-like uncharacterized protein
VKVNEYPPNLLSSIAGFPVNGGQVRSISVNPKDNSHIIVANEFGGLWKTVDRGSSWFHIDSLSTLFVVDIAYADDGNTVYATLTRDNAVINGGGIWVSRDGGDTWSKPVTSNPPKHEKVPDRSSAYGIGCVRGKPGAVFVGTDYGIAMSLDYGRTWSHEMMGRIDSVAAAGDNGIAVGSNTFNLKEKSGPWKRTVPGYFYDPNYKAIDFFPSDNDKALLLSTYYGSCTLLLYEFDSHLSTRIPIPKIPFGSPSVYSRFVRISKSVALEGGIDIWVGTSTGLIIEKFTDNV